MAVDHERLKLKGELDSDRVEPCAGYVVCHSQPTFRYVLWTVRHWHMPREGDSTDIEYARCFPSLVREGQ